MCGISDTRMVIDIKPTSTLHVTLSKSVYEQVLKTTDNMAYGGDIDDIEGNAINIACYTSICICSIYFSSNESY